MKIPKLKPNSPEFWTEEPETRKDKRICDHEGCQQEGLYKAPKSTNKTNEYYYFCLTHIKEYNDSWNYFDDFTEDELHDYMRRSQTWDRPTWKAGVHPFMEQKLRDRVFEFFKEEPTQKKRYEERFKNGGEKEEDFNSSKIVPEMEALDVLGITPPTDLDSIKKRYKVLVKKYHPDTNRDDEQADHKIKKINAAYTLLKTAYSSYEKLKDR